MVNRQRTSLVDIADTDTLGQAGSERRSALPPLFYSEEEAAQLLGIHRTTLRTLAVHGCSPVPPVQITEHKRIYRRIDVERLAGVAP
ncbi:helix-turn-helix domain-containing protein [Microbacterium sp. LBN7]|uniref:helix-turn-helix domain-containing protein n=1 Tax=unclassified Microbacterium TaxID=2609290 RepID=UPI00388EF6CA